MKMFKRKPINHVVAEQSHGVLAANGIAKRHVSRESGFTLTEVLAAVGIVGVLSAIAVPVTLSQQAKAADVTTRSDLTSAASAIESALLTWRGAPIEGTLNICHNEVTYPSESAPEYGCQPEEWVATVASNAALTNPPLGGKLSPGVTMTGRISATGAYCITATNSRFGSTPFYLDSDTSQVNEGTCYTAGWVDPSEGVDDPGITPEPELPAAPTGLSVNVASNVATVSWNGEANVTYAVSVSSQPIKTLTASTDAVQTCVFPATQCSGPSIAYLPTGTYTATVRAQGEAGWGPGATIDFGVTTMPPGGPDGGTPEQITTIFGSDALYATLFGPQASSSALENYITTPTGREDFERLMFSAPQTVLNSTTAMNAVVGSPTAMNTVILDPPVYGSYTISSAAMRAILANSSALSSVVQSSTAMSLIASSRSAMSALANSPTGMAAVLASTVAINEISNSSVAVYQVVTTPSALTALVSSETAITRFVESSTAMSTLVGSSIAMEAFSSSATAMGVLADSFSAMNAIATSPSARTAITSSATAMDVVNTKSVALGKLIAGAAGLDPSQYGDVPALISSPVAMNSVAASGSARNLVANSELSMSLLETNEMAIGKYVSGTVGIDPTLVSGASGLAGFNLTRVFGNETAWNLLTRSDAGITALAGSRASMDTVAANAGMYNDLLGRTASLNAIAGSEPARTAFLSSAFTSSIIGYDTRYIAKFLAGAGGLTPTGFESMTDLTDNASAWQTVVSSPTAVNALVASPYARSQVSGSARTTLYGSTMAVAKLMVADANLSPAGYDSITQLITSGVWAGIITLSEASMNTLAQSPAAVGAVAANGTAVADLVRSPTAVTEMLKETSAVDALVTSSTAMDAISFQGVSRERFNNNSYALSKIRANKMSIGKFVAGWAGLTPGGFADIDAIAVNQTAMNTIAGSAAAVAALAGSDLGTSSVTSSTIASTSLAASKTAMDILRESPIAMLNFSLNAPAITAVNQSNVALNSLKESAVAMDAIANSTAALDVLLVSTAAMPLFASSPTAMDSLSANPVSSSRILANAYPIGVVQSVPEAIGKLAAGVATDNKSAVEKVVSASSLSRLNLVPNPSAETNITGWASAGSATPTLSRSTDVGWAGSSSLQVTSSQYGANVSRARFESTSGNGLRVDGLHRYTVSAYVQSGTSRTATIALEWRNNAGNIISTSESSTTALLVGEWNRISLSWEAPATAVTVVPVITIDSVQYGESQYVDGVMLENSPRITPDAYFDGSTSGGAWDGTAHASTSQWGIITTVLANPQARGALFGSSTGMAQLTYETRVIDALRAEPDALLAAEASVTSAMVRTGAARTDARRLVNRWATLLNGVSIPGVGERLRMSLGDSFGTGALGRLYGYDNDVTQASMTESATGNVPASVPAGSTRFDLTNATDNLATTPTNFCISVNYNGQTVWQEYRGYVDGNPVNNCAADVPVMNDNTVARTLSNPTITSAAMTAAGQIGTRTTSVSGGGTNVLRHEWAFPSDGVSGARPGTAAATATVLYNNTNARNAQYRIQGSGGEARTPVAVTPGPLVTVLTTQAGRGGTGGTAYYNGAGGAGGAGGDWAQATLNVTSLPYSFTLAGLGASGNGGAGGANVGGGGGGGEASGAAGTGYTASGIRCSATGACRVFYTYYGSGGGGGAGFSPSIWNGGTLFLRARGGNGGAGGTDYYAGGAGGATDNTTTSGGGVYNVSATYGSQFDTQSYARIQADAISFNTLYSSNTTATLPAGG